MECRICTQINIRCTVQSVGGGSDTYISADVVLVSKRDSLLLSWPLTLFREWRVVHFHQDLVEPRTQRTSNEGGNYRHPPPPISRPAQIKKEVIVTLFFQKYSVFPFVFFVKTTQAI